jgi:hypothetical protein
MGHLLSSALRMQTSAVTQLQYSFADFAGVDGSMAIYFNTNQPLNLTTTTGLTTVTLSPASQTISSNIINFADTGTNIDYYVNDVFIQSFSNGGTTANTGDITTSAGNTYKFVGTAG